MEKKDESKPYKGICCKACYLAKGDKCRCKCKKKYHGLGVIKRLSDIEAKKNENNNPASSRTTS